MDILTHLFLPLTVAYVLQPSLLKPPRRLSITIFAVLPDVDKLLGVPGLLHSLLATIPASIVLLGVGRRYDARRYALIAVLLLHSHLLLDILDGGPVPLLYPLVREGIGLTFPAELVLNQQIGSIRNPLPAPRMVPTKSDRVTYSLVTGYGVLSALSFLLIYVGTQYVDSAHSRR